MKRAHIVEQTPIQSGRRYWFVLEAVDPPAPDGKPLQYASARSRRADRPHVDPDERRKALAELHAWADANGWTVVK